MNNKLVQELKKRLEKEKVATKEQLETFANQDPKLKGDWDTRFPKSDGTLEGAADEVEEYASRLPVEYSLENKLKDVNIALDKIAQGKYGQCEKCHKKIDEKRLAVQPEARLCMKCQE